MAKSQDARKEAKKKIKNPNRAGVYPKSVVVQYFLKRKHKFSDLNW